MMSSQDFRPMDERKHVSVDFTNQALIQDQLLVSICLVLEHGRPDPRFCMLSALSLRVSLSTTLFTLMFCMTFNVGMRLLRAFPGASEIPTLSGH
jgi:hypothetical protein